MATDPNQPDAGKNVARPDVQEPNDPPEIPLDLAPPPEDPTPYDGVDLSPVTPGTSAAGDDPATDVSGYDYLGSDDIHKRGHHRTVAPLKELKLEEEVVNAKGPHPQHADQHGKPVAPPDVPDIPSPTTLTDRQAVEALTDSEKLTAILMMQMQSQDDWLDQMVLG